jgi:hypothetical protein
MIKFTTDNEQSFEYPESLSDVTLKQYLEYLEFVESTKPKAQIVRPMESSRLTSSF